VLWKYFYLLTYLRKSCAVVAKPSVRAVGVWTFRPRRFIGNRRNGRSRRGNRVNWFACRNCYDSRRCWTV